MICTSGSSSSDWLHNHKLSLDPGSKVNGQTGATQKLSLHDVPVLSKFKLNQEGVMGTQLLVIRNDEEKEELQISV